MSEIVPQQPETTAHNTTETLNISELRSAPKAVTIGRGVSWLTESWALIMKEPAVFAAISVISLIAIFILNLIPVLGSFATALLWPALAAGFFLAFRHAKRSESVTANDLFEPFKKPANLIGLGAIYLAASIFVTLALLLIAFLSMGSIAAVTSGDIDMMQMGTGLFIMALVAIPASLALVMAFIFAPVLVHQHQIPVVEAIKRSFAGSLRNILPLIVFFVVLTLSFMIIGVLTAIPLLGWLIAIALAVLYLPLGCGALFCAYNDIFLQHSNPEL